MENTTIETNTYSTLSDNRDIPLEWKIGNIVRKIRKERKFTQTKLSHKSKLADNTIHTVENGGRSASIRTLQIIANTLNCDLIVEFRKRDSDE